MKKQIRSRNKNSAPRSKPENLTKASSRKHRQKKFPKRELKNIKVQPLSSLDPSQLQSEDSMKNQSETVDMSTDIPQNINIESYLDDIDDHIISVDQKFHSGLEERLKIAGNIQISSQMRKILIKWLVKVSLKFRMQQESLHICVQLIDYMLIHKGVLFNKTNFQLLGVACLFISCKYNQIYTLDANKYIQLCDGIYTLNQLFQMESLILLQMNFNLQVPTLCQFINKIVHSFKISNEQQLMIKALVDLSIFDFNMLNNFRKHDLAIAIVYFTTKLKNLNSLKEQLSGLKMKICPQIFKKCFISVMSLFKKQSQTPNHISI